MYREKRIYESLLEHEIGKVDSIIRALKHQDSEVPTELRTKLQWLEGRRAEAKRQLEKLETTGALNWESLREDSETVLEELRRATASFVWMDRAIRGQVRDVDATS